MADTKPDYGMPVHPVCDLFPLMDAKSLAGLAGDIKANGLVNAIVLHEGQIVDGRNRLLACRSAGIEPRFVQWCEIYTGPMPIDGWIWSLNVERRHLTPDQIAWAIVQRRAWQEEQAARKRKVDAGKQFHKGSPKVPVEAPEPLPRPKGEIREILAQEAGISTNKIRQALEVQKLAQRQVVGPETADQLRQGTVKLHEVLKQARPNVATVVVDQPQRAPALVQEEANSNTPTSRHDAPSKRRLTDALSQIRGHCRGLLELDASAIRRACTAEETETWAEIAHNAAKDLRLFSRRLTAATATEDKK